MNDAQQFPDWQKPLRDAQAALVQRDLEAIERAKEAFREILKVVYGIEHDGGLKFERDGVTTFCVKAKKFSRSWGDGEIRYDFTFRVHTSGEDAPGRILESSAVEFDDYTVMRAELAEAIDGHNAETTTSEMPALPTPESRFMEALRTLIQAELGEFGVE